MHHVIESFKIGPSSRDRAKQGSIRIQLMLYSLALALVPLMVLFALSYVQARGALSKSTREALSNLADVTVDQVQEWLATRQTEVEIMANAPEIVSMEPQRVMRALTFYREKWGDHYETLLVIQPDGVVLASTDGQRNNVSDREYFKQAMAGRTVISEPLISKGSIHVVVVVATPIRSLGQVVGVMAAVVPTLPLQMCWQKPNWVTQAMRT